MSTPTANTKAPTAETAGHVNKAVTKVDQFLTELDGGQFAVMVAEALSIVPISQLSFLNRNGQPTNGN